MHVEIFLVGGDGLCDILHYVVVYNVLLDIFLNKKVFISFFRLVEGIILHTNYIVGFKCIFSDIKIGV